MFRATVTAAILVAPLSAGAAGECPAKGGPWVRIDAHALSPALQTNVLVQLRAALARRNLTACEGGVEHPLATITLAPSEEDVRIAVSVRDEVTNKLVERTVKLADLPADARGLALAQMTDELLRASWAELTVEDAPPPAIVVPPEVHDALPRPRARWRAALDAAFVLDHFSASHDQLGVDAAFHLWPTSRLGVVLRAGPRGALARTTAPGTISSTGLFAAIGPSVSLVALPRFGLDLEADAGILYVGIGGKSAAAEQSADGLVVLFMGTVSAWLRLAPLRLFLDAGGGGAARGVRVVSGNTDLGGPAGALFTMRAGIGVDL